MCLIIVFITHRFCSYVLHTFIEDKDNDANRALMRVPDFSFGVLSEIHPVSFIFQRVI
jgi:hypothetical protein